ncbi:hypothetical protein GC175_22075 [bacterium]|nr:hypothetical protein [bacterium]
MIWRVVVIAICIVIVVSAVWAASDSFEVRVDSPKTFDAEYTIVTPTPMPLPVNYSFRMETKQSGPEPIYVDVPLSDKHVVLMNGNPAEELADFHLCRGTVSRCNGGIQSFDAEYIDLQGDGVADRLRVYFTWENFETLLSTVDADTTNTGSAAADLTSTQVTTLETPVGSATITPSMPAGFVEPSTDRYSRIRLTISGDLYAWKIAQP